MVQKHHMTMLSINYVSAFCMGLYANSGSYIKYTYIIGWEHSHIVLPNYTSLFQYKI